MADREPKCPRCRWTILGDMRLHTRAECKRFRRANVAIRRWAGQRVGRPG